MKNYKFPKHEILDCEHLIKLEALLNTNQDIDSNTKSPNQTKGFLCGETLLRHINNNNLQGGFCVIQIMNLHRSYIYGGAIQNLNVWKQIFEIIASCLPDEAYLIRVSLGIAIHSWGQDIENKFKITLRQIRHKLLFMENESFIDESAIHLPIVTSIGYLIYPDDCGREESFLPITKYVSLASIDLESDYKSSRLRQYHPNLTKKANERLETEQKLINAILNYDFELYYQPVFDLLNQKVVSVESLLRWTDSTLSNNKNYEYIPLIENSKYIIDFTKHSFNVLIDFIQNKHHLFSADFKLSFNLSQAVFKWENFQLVNMIENAIKIFPSLPRFLIIEITESAYFSKTISERVISSLTQIKELGIQIAIDDFGSGYGALKLISSNIPDIIKLDRELTQEICNQQADSTFLKSLIYAASLSKFKIIAEGIETNTQQSLMIYYGVRFGQGYNFSKPLNEKDFLNYISES